MRMTLPRLYGRVRYLTILSWAKQHSLANVAASNFYFSYSSNTADKTE